MVSCMVILLTLAGSPCNRVQQLLQRFRRACPLWYMSQGPPSPCVELPRSFQLFVELSYRMTIPFNVVTSVNGGLGYRGKEACGKGATQSFPQELWVSPAYYGVCRRPRPEGSALSTDHVQYVLCTVLHLSAFHINIWKRRPYGDSFHELRGSFS